MEFFNILSGAQILFDKSLISQGNDHNWLLCKQSNCKCCYLPDFVLVLYVIDS